MTFKCDTCGGDVVEIQGKGRLFQFRPGVNLEIPKDFPVPTCRQCGERHLSTTQMGELEAVLARAFASYVETLLNTAMSAARISQRELEIACGVTPTYLSKVRAGANVGTTLLRLIDIYARFPEEALRYVPGHECEGNDATGKPRYRWDSDVEVLKLYVSESVTIVPFQVRTSDAWQPSVIESPAEEAFAS